ncbi:MAG: hypothetical protein GY801_36130 [bacterium]|nr:hypothetical protein [bacterium]
MYGINLVELARILATAAGGHLLFSKHGVIHSIYQEIIRFSAEQNIAMVKVMMQTLARQNENAYHDVVELLHEHFTEEELREILP